MLDKPVHEEKNSTVATCSSTSESSNWSASGGGEGVFEIAGNSSSGYGSSAYLLPQSSDVAGHNERIDLASSGAHWAGIPSLLDTEQCSIPNVNSNQQGKFLSRDFAQDQKKAKLESTDDFAEFEASSSNADLSLDDLDNLVIAQQGTVTPEKFSADIFSKTSSFRNGEALSALTQQLNQMSVTEREKALYDLHGVSGSLPEQNAEQIERWLYQMGERLPQQANDHPGLAKAMELDLDFVRLERIKFLHADEYDPVKATERMGFYFDMKYDFFCGVLSPKPKKGIKSDCFSCLTRDLTIDDLTQEDLAYWRSGFYQVCPEKDRAGRIVCIIFLPLCYRLQIPTDTMVRVYLVLNAILTQNVDVQRSGNVHIAYAVGLGEDSLFYIGSDHFANSVVKAGRWAPLRGVAKHFCYDHESLHTLFGKFAKPMATFNAVRYRSHFGTHAEVQYNLLTFGIPADSLQVSNDGTVDTKYHNGFIDSLLEHQLCRDEKLKGVVSIIGGGKGRLLEASLVAPGSIVWSRESVPTKVVEVGNPDMGRKLNCSRDASNANESTIIAINPMDVILGRRSNNKQNLGNLRLKVLLEENFALYDAPSSNRTYKSAIVSAIAKTMKDSGSRFLCNADEWSEEATDRSKRSTEYCRWTVASNDKIREKISHDFRNMRRSMGNRQKKDDPERSSKELLKRLMEPNNESLALKIEHLVAMSFDRFSPLHSSKHTATTLSVDSSSVKAGDLDILLGRSRRKRNLGNMILTQILEVYSEEYEVANLTKAGAASNAQKLSIVEKVLHRVQESNVRFLVCGPDGNLVPAPPEKVYDKITQDFRNLRCKKKKNRQLHEWA